MQVRFITLLMSTLAFAFIALWFTGSNPCVNYAITWLGVLPMIVAATVTTGVPCGAQGLPAVALALSDCSTAAL